MSRPRVVIAASKVDANCYAAGQGWRQTPAGWHDGENKLWRWVPEDQLRVSWLYGMHCGLALVVNRDRFEWPVGKLLDDIAERKWDVTEVAA